MQCKTLHEWDEWMRNHNRIVAKTVVKGVVVTTIFLGMNHAAFGSGAPILFETMLFTEIGSLGFQERYCTWDEAEAGHQRAIAYVISSLPGASR